MKIVDRIKGLFKVEPYAKEALPSLRYRIWKASMWMVIAEVVLLIQVYPQKWFFDFANQKNAPWLYAIAVLLGIGGIITLFIYIKMDSWRNDFNHCFYAMWMSAGQRKELSLPAEWHAQHGTGEKEALIRSNITKVDRFYDQLAFHISPVFGRIVLTTLLLFAFAWWGFSLLSLITFIVYFFVMHSMSKQMVALSIEYSQEKQDLEQKGPDLPQNWRTIKVLGLEQYFSEQYQTMCNNFWLRDLPRHTIWRKLTRKQDYVIHCSRTILYMLGGYMLAYNSEIVSLGMFVLVSTWMDRSYHNYGRLSEVAVYTFNGFQSLNKLLNIFETKSVIEEPVEPIQPGQQDGAIEFRNVSFSYEDRTTETLTNIDLSVPAKTIVAIIGPSGCGKTTLMSLLTAFYRPTKGDIFIDGVNLRDMNTEWYRRNYLGVVLQELGLFDDTVLGNIRAGKLDATLDEVQAAAKAANAHNFIMELENGYDTRIGENGIRLSGGQKQRLVIARALIGIPKILILDEATSALDAESQALVHETIDNRLDERQCTTFIISHRMSTIEKADLIIAIENGQITEKGTHAQLSKRNGTYARFKALEQRGFLN